MQIDLFKNDAVNELYNKIGNQIRTRRYKQQYSLDPVDKIESNDKVFLAYRERLHKLALQEKEEHAVSNLKADSHADLELLGIAEYARTYTVVLDFSQTLDFVLSEVTGCKQELIRAIPEYENISYAMFNGDFSSVSNVGFASIMGVDSKLDDFLKRIIIENYDAQDTHDVSDITMMVLFDFYGRITAFIQKMKNYVATALNYCGFSTNIIYRSKTYSSIILTSNTAVKEDILINGEHGSTVITPQNYRMYEYAKRLGGVTV